MARIEDLIEEIQDPDLRDKVARQVKQLKSTKRFGLVFEDHVPETVSLYGLPVRPGSIVQNRRKPDDPTRLQVLSVEGGKARVAPVGADEPVEVLDTLDLLTVKAFEEPIFPGLTPAGEVRRGPEDKPVHTVISAENFHALQLLSYTHAGQIDVIYIDPPYNTGARDWKYNNRFVDDNDSWRHSKWLAMMEKRLRLSRKLLRRDGVLVVTIDEHEVHHLGLLLEAVFPDAYCQMVTTVTNHAGVSQGGFARVEEYAFFLFFGAPRTSSLARDLAGVGRKASNRRPTYWYSLVRSGTNANPSDRPNLVYPIFIDPSTRRIVGTGTTSLGDGLAPGLQRDSFDDWMPDLTETTPEGMLMAWPVRSDGRMGNWRVGRETLARYIEAGYVRAGAFDAARGTTSVTYLKTGTIEKIERGELVIAERSDATGVVDLRDESSPLLHRPKTVWMDTAHDAGKQGSVILKALLGRKVFDFPKSPYLVADALAVLVSEAPNAVILDYFGGSATTLHAVALLNARDNGRRRCILVTNNDVSDSESKRLNRSGYFAGDSVFEAQGIFESVAMPRVEATITGIRPDGRPVVGTYLEQYLSEHDFSDGLKENVAFFRMDYLEPELVELGRQFNAIAPLLWMAAGSIGSWEEWDGEAPWTAPATSTYAVLFDLAEGPVFGALVESRQEITHAWIVTDSHTAFVELRSELPDGVQVGQLYREYLRNFTVNAPGVLD